MQRKLKVFLAAFSVCPLGACASFPLFHSAHAGSASSLAQAGAASDTYLQVGRQQLDQGQTGAAVDSFRVALAMGEDPAAALNGLGVAYARLGRNDAAATLFAKAAMLDPTNQRYARNLARADSAREDAVLAVSSSPDPAGWALSAPQHPPLPGQLSRVSANEVEVAVAPQPITTGLLPVVATRAPQDAGPAKKAPLTVAQRLAVSSTRAGESVQVDPRFKPLVRVALLPPVASARSALHRRAVALTSKPEAPVTPDFVPLVRMQFADAVPTKSKGKIVVIAER